MRAVLRPLPLIIFALALPLLDGHVMAQGIASAQATAQSGDVVLQAPLAAPQAVLSAPQAALAPAYGTCGASAALAAPLAAPSCSYQAAALQAAPVYDTYAVQPQLQIVQRQVYAAPVYVQRQVVQQAIVSPYVVRQQAVVGYGTQALAQANVAYGHTINAGVARGIRANGLVVGRQRAQRTVSRSKAVTRTGRPGLVNRVLGR